MSRGQILLCRESRSYCSPWYSTVLIKAELCNASAKNIQAIKLIKKDPNISDYEKYLSLKLGYEVQIKDKKGKGKISVKYQNLDQLEEIISIFNEKK